MRNRLVQLRAAVERTNKVAGIALAVLVCLFWVQFLRPQSLGGNAAYVLVSGKSMLPRYHTGDLVLVEKHSSYHVGQLIAYRVPKGDPMAGAEVIHRIIGGSATKGFIVKGDNRMARVIASALRDREHALAPVVLNHDGIAGTGSSRHPVFAAPAVSRQHAARIAIEDLHVGEAAGGLYINGNANK